MAPGNWIDGDEAASIRCLQHELDGWKLEIDGRVSVDQNYLSQLHNTHGRVDYFADAPEYF
jgi:hypothetical protein